MRTQTLALLVVTLCTGVQRAQAAPRIKMAVMPTHIDAAVRNEVPGIIDDYILTAVQGYEQYDVIGQDDINAVLGFEKQKEMLGCDETQCFAAIGGALGVQKLLSIKVARVNTQWATSAKVLDVQGEPRVELRATEFVEGDSAALLRAIPGLVRKLFGGGGSAQAAAPAPTSSAPLTCSGATSCYAEGDDYYYGRNGKPNDFIAAAAHYKRSCDFGDMSGCNDYAYLHDEGKGVARNYDIAHAYYGKACTARNGRSCRALASLFDEGKGVTLDDVKALKLYEQACELGFMGGCNDAAVMYENGEGVTADIDRAVGLYRQACDQDHALGCANLGLMYEKGKGVGADLDVAMQLYERACAAENEKGCERRTKLQPRLAQRGCAAGAPELLGVLAVGLLGLFGRRRTRL